MNGFRNGLNSFYFIFKGVTVVRKAKREAGKREGEGLVDGDGRPRLMKKKDGGVGVGKSEDLGGGTTKKQPRNAGGSWQLPVSGTLARFPLKPLNPSTHLHQLHPGWKGRTAEPRTWAEPHPFPTVCQAR